MEKYSYFAVIFSSITENQLYGTNSASKIAFKSGAIYETRKRF